MEYLNIKYLNIIINLYKCKKMGNNRNFKINIIIVIENLNYKRNFIRFRDNIAIIDRKYTKCNNFKCRFFCDFVEKVLK